MFETLFFQPVLNLVIFLYNIVPGNDLGIAIVLLTIIIKLLLLPLSKKSLKSQKALQELQPKIEEIKKKHKDNKEEMSRAMMGLYKTNKVNPFSSCLPLLIQLPFLIAVFRVFREGFDNGSLDLLYSFVARPEAINYISFGFLDLAEKNTVIAVLAGMAQFWQTKMMLAKKPTVEPKTDSKNNDMMAIMNKQMMYMMPVLTVFIAMSFPAGLGLYWLVTTILTGVQQKFLFNKKEKDDKGDKKNNNNKVVEGEIIEKK